MDFNKNDPQYHAIARRLQSENHIAILQNEAGTTYTFVSRDGTSPSTMSQMIGLINAMDGMAKAEMPPDEYERFSNALQAIFEISKDCLCDQQSP